MIYTFTSIVPHVTIDFLRFDRCVWHTSNPEEARMAREHPLFGKDFFDATPDLPLPKKKEQNPERREAKLEKMSLKKLKDLCVINALNRDGTDKVVLIERLNSLKEIRWELKKSTTPVLEMANIAYAKRKRLQRHRTKVIGR